MSSSSSKRSASRWLVLFMVAGLVGAPAAGAYTFGPTVRQTGPEETMFDWTTQRCEAFNIPDAPTRAYRDAAGQVHVMISHVINHQMIGPTLGSVQLSCGITMSSDNNGDPAAFEDREWIQSPYTFDGNTVFALVHNEYQGRSHDQCTTTQLGTCRFHSVTLAVSNDSGATYTHAAPPGHLVMSEPYTYVPDLPVYGYDIGNIVKGKDGWFYILITAEPYGAQQPGTCVARTRRIADPTSWRAWDGSGFDVEFVNPYTSTDPPEQHVCEPVSYDEIEKMSTLTYNTFLHAYLLVGSSVQYDPVQDKQVYGFYYSTSQDLIHWSPRALLMEAVLPSTFQCGDEDPVQYPSLLDPNSSDRNFNTTGRSMYLYYTKDHFNQFCRQTLDRDLVRVPFEFPVDGATPGFPRPKGATPIRVALVQAYQPCADPNDEHGEPLVTPSCSPPQQQSSLLTVGTGDANGFPANSTGSIQMYPKLDVASTPEDETDVRLSAVATDVRRAHDFAAYTGELQASADLRLTDLQNGLSGDPATTQDFPFAFAVPCRTQGSLRRVGATCSTQTSANALMPGAVAAGRHALWQLGQVKLYDGGEDGVADTPDNTLFEIQGVFTP